MNRDSGTKMNSKKRILHLSAVCICTIFIGMFLSACAIKETYDNRHKLENLRIGMTKEQVKNIMGEPLVNEVYNTSRVWYYYTRNKWFDGNVTRDECTPLVFDDYGHLEGWGQEYYKTNYSLGNWTQKDVSDAL